jgi:polar amino acid transport system substrate-binding protein
MRSGPMRHKIGVTRATTNDIIPTKTALPGTIIRRCDDDASTRQALHWLNTDIFTLRSDGEIQALQKRWLGAANTDLPRF